MKLEEKIALLRKQKGWSQEELAFRLDVSRQAVSKWEMGASLPEVDKILKMSELFGCSTDYLLKEENTITEGQVRDEQPKMDEEQGENKPKKKAKTLGDVLEDLFWLIILCVYLIWSFASGDWHITWIIWPVAGVSFSIIELIVKAVKLAKENKKK